MIFNKIKRDFPEMHIMCNKVSDLSHHEKINLSWCITRDIANPRMQQIKDLLGQYQSTPTKILNKRLYKALKVYYNE